MIPVTIMCYTVRPVDYEPIDRVFTVYPLTECAQQCYSLKAIQRTGIIPVSGYRVGKNCLPHSWYLEYIRLFEADHQVIVSGRPDPRTRDRALIIFKDDIEEWINKYCPNSNRTEDKWFDMPTQTDYDFLYVIIGGNNAT